MSTLSTFFPGILAASEQQDDSRSTVSKRRRDGSESETAGLSSKRSRQLHWQEATQRDRLKEAADVVQKKLPDLLQDCKDAMRYGFPDPVAFREVLATWSATVGQVNNNAEDTHRELLESRLPEAAGIPGEYS